MRKAWLLLLAALVGCASTKAPNASEGPSAARKTSGYDRQELLGILREHSYDGYVIVRRVLDSGAVKNDTWDWLAPDNNLSDNLNTLVHEYNHTLASGYQFYNVFLTSDDTLKVMTTKTFPSREIADEIPEKLRTFRFPTYIKDSPDDQSTQVNGVYGLLDELNSYYQGTKVSYDLFEYYRANFCEENPERYLDYLQGMYGSYYAYYEFKLYIYTYLLRAERKNPRVFKAIVKNRAFVTAFRNVDAAYSDLIFRMREREREIAGIMAGRNAYFAITDEFTFAAREIAVKNAVSTRRGIGNFRNEAIPLEAELRKEKYVDLGKRVFSIE